MTTRLAALGLAAAAVLAAPVARAITVSVADHGAPVADVVVALDPLDGVAPAAAARATIDQVQKRFVPRISVVRTGTSVEFPNSDNIRHQVYSFSAAKPFTLKLYAGRAAPPVVFDHPGLVILGCNIHDTMIAYVAVVDTPYFGRTDAAGQLVLHVPSGRYRMRVWHPDLAAPVPPATVTVDRDERELTVAVARAAEPGNVSPWSD